MHLEPFLGRWWFIALHIHRFQLPTICLSTASLSVAPDCGSPSPPVAQGFIELPSSKATSRKVPLAKLTEFIHTKQLNTTESLIKLSVVL
jgi:hypothetical protein